MLRLKVLPISIAIPWGLNVGDMLGHIPLPAKLTIEVLPPIDLHEEFGAEPDPDEIYDRLDAADAGHARRAGRRTPVPNDRMRIAAALLVAAPPEPVWELMSDPGRALNFIRGVTRWEVEGAQADRAWARATGC